ncbi:HigA family addiction module antidote protein [Chitinimonas arctica]|uniref:HigA family addiction module antidote protein n=1 Tax=Chitinimonas arctica TaxID=2594795 RepID=A0A516SDG0_9NEIS|nr:HigA family addiction module antitoxin [Chitinimonas arctica]QDQ26179.1 HigA family addiction module antidote protein [Chitinimonas arctica]
MHMHNPAHPGEILKDWLDDLDQTIAGFADRIDVSRTTMSKIINGHSRVTADVDLRLAAALGTTEGYWLRIQTQRDLWEAKQQARPNIQRLALAA